MRQFDDLEEREMTDALRAAVTQSEAERERQMTRVSHREAAAELGVSEAQLDRAAAHLHAQRVARIRSLRRIRNGVLGTGLALVAALAGARILDRPEPVPITYNFEAAAQRWGGEHNAGSSAQAAEQGGRGVIEVIRFTPESDGRYWANLNTTTVPPSLHEFQEVSLRIRGDGGLSQARIFIENGPTERWRSPAIAVGRDWRTIRFRLDQFEHQTRGSTLEPWRGRRSGEVDQATGLSIKVGHPFNPSAATGRVEVDDLRFE